MLFITILLQGLAVIFLSVFFYSWGDVGLTRLELCFNTALPIKTSQSTNILHCSGISANYHYLFLFFFNFQREQAVSGHVMLYLAGSGG